MTATRSIVIASAGSGKTYTLANRLIAWMIDRSRTEGDPGCDRILASTFTRKAAGEILQRVLQHLAKAVLDPEVRERYEQSMELDPPPSRAEYSTVLAALVRSLHRLQVSTLDGIFHRISACFASEIGLPSHWSIAETSEEDRLRIQSMHALMEDSDREFMGDLLHMIQRGNVKRSVHDAIENLVWGRSGVLDLHRSTRLLPDPRAPWAWLTPPGDGRMLDGGRRRSDDILAAAVEAMGEVSLPLTKKGAVNKKFKKGWDVARMLAGEADWELFLSHTLVRSGFCGPGTYQSVVIEEELVGVMQPLVEHAKAEVIETRHRELMSAWGLLGMLEIHYRRRQERAGRFTFDDIAQRLAEAGVVRHGSLGHLWFRLDSMVRDLALDEFQDTSLRQFEVLDPIIEEILSGEGAVSDRGFLVLADPKQSIYGWRGGTPALVDMLEERYADRLDETSPLVRSWRSSQVVLDGVDAVLGNLAGNPVFSMDKSPPAAREGAEHWSTRYNRHEAARDLPGLVQVHVPDIGSEKPGVEHTIDAAVDCIIERHHLDPESEIGVLTSRNDAASRIVALLRRRGVEASEEGQSVLTDSLAVGAMLSLMHLADHPGDLRSLYHVTATPIGALFDLEPMELADRSGQYAMARRLSLRIRTELFNRGYGEYIQDLVARLRPSCGARDARRLGYLAELAVEWDEQATLRSMDFIRFVEGRPRGSVASSPVRVMTIHASKGLEFDEVILPELDRKLVGNPKIFFAWGETSTGPPTRIVPALNRNLRPHFPTINETCFPSWQREQIQDSLSVLYVAMTRAKHALHLVLRPIKEGKEDSELPFTMEGLIRGALEGLDDTMRVHGERDKRVLWTSGDPNWYQQVDGDRETARPSTAPRRPALVFPSSQPVPSERTSPSSSTARPPLREQYDLDPGWAMLRGTVLHELFRLVDWMEDGVPGEDAIAEAMRMAAVQGGRPVPTHMQEETRSAFLEALARPGIAHRLSRVAYEHLEHDEIEACQEQAFLLPTSEGIVAGRYDRVVLGRRDGLVCWADIVDYKSDSATAETAPGILESYRSQLETYIESIRVIHGLDSKSVTARLLLLGPGLDVELPGGVIA